MILDKSTRYRVHIVIKMLPEDERPKIGDILELNDCLASIVLVKKKWLILEILIRNKVDYIDSLSRMKEGEWVFIKEWFPSGETINYEVRTLKFEVYQGRLEHIIKWEDSISSHP